MYWRRSLSGDTADYAGDMAYPRENLAPGEVVVVHRHPHWKSLAGPVLLFWLATAVAGLLLGLLWGADSLYQARPWGTVVIAALWAAAVIWWLARPVTTWISTHFVVTDRRVIYRRGLLTRSGIDIPISRINTVEFEHGLTDRILRTGSLQIQSASEEPLTFVDIPRVEAVHALLYEQLLDEAEDDVRSRW